MEAAKQVLISKAKEAARQVLSSKEYSVSTISISVDYGSIISKIVRGRRRGRSVRPFDVSQLLSVVKSILLLDHTNPKPLNVDSAMAEVIRKLSCKLACGCSMKNAQQAVEEILGNNYLPNYDWDAVMVTSLAAFATNYAKFRVFVESSVNDNSQVFKNILLLKQLPEFENARKLVGEIDKVVALAVEMIEAALKLIDLRRANSAQISTSSGSTDYVAQAACYTIHIVVICASLITAPTDGFVVSKMESTLSNLINDVIKPTYEILRAETDATSQQHGDWQTLVDVFYNTKVPTIAAMLKALIKPDANGKSTLVNGNNSRIEVSFEQIKGENIYLLISGGHISEKEIQYISELMKKDTKCQLVWIPIYIDFERFSKIQRLMNWYTVPHPSQIRPATVKFIKETWMFQGQTILVPLGQKEPEFYPIDWLWARGSFPSGVDSQPPPLPQLSLGYLLSDIYQFKTTTKTTSLPVICLYGGEDLVWIKNFSKLLGEVSKYCTSKFQVNIEFIYVSSSEGIDAENAEIFDHLNATNFGCSWKADGIECWRFWIRVESFFREKIRIGTDMNDIIKEALTLLSYNANHKGWVVFGQYGTDLKLAQATGIVADSVLRQITKLNVRQANSAAFIEALSFAFNEQGKKLPHHCSHIILPASVGDLGDYMTCPICDKMMTNYRYYRCCV